MLTDLLSQLSEKYAQAAVAEEVLLRERFENERQRESFLDKLVNGLFADEVFFRQYSPLDRSRFMKYEVVNSTSSKDSVLSLRNEWSGYFENDSVQAIAIYNSYQVGGFFYLLLRDKASGKVRVFTSLKEDKGSESIVVLNGKTDNGVIQWAESEEISVSQLATDQHFMPFYQGLLRATRDAIDSYKGVQQRIDHKKDFYRERSDQLAAELKVLASIKLAQ
ncbi:hypothetical protein HYX03_04715 [Candidatus Woesearchaeota archaeon]|nr:hypothetical protein [Candidatus Woesearchaeota archaeon]